jgi:hypothetical protein
MPSNFINADYSQSATQMTFDRLKDNFQQNSWLKKRNHYAKYCTTKIDNECKSAGGVLKNQNQLAEYIAASIPIHCMDGWGFLGRSIASHAVGDNGAANHFAYYAQLRAVMSILASEGIGIFDKNHFAIKTASSKISKLAGPVKNNTHKLVDLQFKVWANSQRSFDFLKKTIRPRGIALENWLNEIAGSSASWLTSKLLNDWGYDIQALSKDQEARNLASYRPSALFKDLEFRTSSNIDNSLELVDGIWRSCSSDGKGGMLIDIYLLKLSWRAYTKAIYSRDPTRSEVGNVLDNLGFTGNELTNLTDFFSDFTKPDLIVISEARKKGDTHDVDYHYQVMSRAAILLRLATGGANTTIRNASITKNDIEFWWGGLGENLGFWQNGATDPLVDVWNEVETALSELTRKTHLINNHCQWRNELSPEILILSGCERIGLSQLCIL